MNALPPPPGRIFVSGEALGGFLADLDGLSFAEWKKFHELGLTPEDLDGEPGQEALLWAAWVYARRHVEPGLEWDNDRIFIPLTQPD